LNQPNNYAHLALNGLFSSILVLVLAVFKHNNFWGMKRYKRYRDYGFRDQVISLSKLSQLGDPLEKLSN